MMLLFKINKFLFLFVLIIRVGCQTNTQTTPVKIDGKIQLKTAPVIMGDITDTISIFGELALRQEAWLSSQFDGRLDEFTMLRGNKVEKGQLAGVIIPAEREALLQASAKISDEYKYILDEQVKSIPLICPISGIVLDVLLHTGDVVSKGSHIVHIGDLKTLDVQGEMPVQFLDIARNTSQFKVEFTNFIAPSISLPIEAFSGEVSQNQSVIVRLKLDNPRLKYRPGMRVKISFPTPVHANALLISRQALVEEEGEYFLFTVENGLTTKHLVEVGIMQNDVVEILSGVKENQQVAIEKAYSLKDNMEVTAE